MKFLVLLEIEDNSQVNTGTIQADIAAGLAQDPTTTIGTPKLIFVSQAPPYLPAAGQTGLQGGGTANPAPASNAGAGSGS